MLGAAGCATEQGHADHPAPSNTVHESVPLPKSTAANAADQVFVSRSLGFGSVNPAPYGIVTAQEQIDIFTKAVQTAQKIEGVLDVAQPDYDAVIQQDGNRREIHLWLNKNSEHGMYAEVSDTGTGYRLSTESTHDLMKLILEMPYDSKQAAANGDLVIANDQFNNWEVWTRFMKNVNAGTKDDIQIVQYTIEGGPIFDNLSFDGKTIRHQFDNTHDAYGSPMKRLEFCKSVKEETTEYGTFYTLAGCGDADAPSETFRLPIP
ncbi:DUF4362 domain-containing protein [Paenibacillus rhizovicinus]|uniref:DUF4362 domain-containing protein n=1 Tax=Paenibacillus rhizovicinus TaxID=2704463 RepID=A0A6C0P4Q8_9BACL|nr:DUF4362 domain-containing protein [Paenibacillus rhizovicinus]QHW33435.1 DUF4362 domain-containing protein [Paenibacillus rhizovicinus]